MKQLVAVSILALLLVGSVVAQEQATLLNNMDNAASFVVSTGATSPEMKMETNTAPAYISEGKGSAHISAVAPERAGGNAYLAFDVPVKPVVLAGSKLVFEAWTSTPEASRGFYVRAYAADGKCVASWLNWGGALSNAKQTFEVTPRFSDVLAWETSMVATEASTPITMVRFYVGTGEKNRRFDLYVDNLRYAASDLKPFEDETAAKPLYRETTIVRDGESECVIVTPNGDDWAEAGYKVAAAIKQASGADVEVLCAEEITDDELTETNAVVLGNVVNNYRLLYPYSHNLTFADGVFPGAGGYEVRSVSDPWGTGKNIIAIGATDVAGAEAGLAVFVEKMGKGATITLPMFVETKLTGAAEARWGRRLVSKPPANYVELEKAKAEQNLADGMHGGLFSQANYAGMDYAMTLQPEYAEAFAWIIQRAYDHYLTKPKTYGGPWGMDSDFNVYRTLPLWDAVEECPSLTDEQRLSVSKILFKWTSEVCPPKTAPASSTMVRFNHQTFPGLGLLYAGQYFARYYDSYEAKKWIEMADGCFLFQLDCTKPHCDCNGYQWLTLTHTIRYCLARPNLKYFENGNITANAEYAIHTMNNLGYQVPYGDMGGWGQITSEMNILRAAEWFNGDGLAQWAINKKMAETNVLTQGAFEAGTADAQAPTALLGAHVYPLDDPWYDSFNGKDFIEREQAFDKVIFRDGFDPSNQYLLLDGLSTGGHGHLDGNSILQWTENGRIWLGEVETTRFSGPAKNHNGVLILKNGQSADIPAFCSMENMADLPTLAVSQTTCSDYAGADWHRYMVWPKSKYFVVVDRMTANEDADYSFRSVWQTVGDADLNGSTLDIEQQGEFGRIALTDDVLCMKTDMPDKRFTWASYPYIDDPTPHVLMGITSAALEAGDEKVLFTALDASGGRQSRMRVTRISETMAVVSGDDEPMLIVAPDRNGVCAISGFLRANADLVIATPSAMYGVNVRGGQIGSQVIELEDSADVEFDVATQKVMWMEPAKTAAHVVQTTRSETWQNPLTAQRIRVFIEGLAANAPEFSPAVAGDGDVAALEAEWDYRDIPKDLLLTANKGTYGAVDSGVTVSATPEPAELNVFSGKAGGNKVGLIVDGQTDGTEACTMWPEGKEVTIDLGFDRVCDVDRVLLQAWFNTTSSKNVKFQIGHVKILASNDGFAKDIRTLADVEDTEEHGNWGAPGHAPELYAYEKLGVQAKDLRLILTPRAGCGVYVAELEVWGNGEGLAMRPLGTSGSVSTFRCLHRADIDGDGVEETLAGGLNGILYCLNADGSVRWIHKYGGSVETVSTADFEGDGNVSVLVGGLGALVRVLDANGKEKWTAELPYYKRVAHVRTIFPADLNGDGKEEVVVGADNWRYYAFDRTGKELWWAETVHGATAGLAADMDGDGADEVIGSTEYYSWWCIDGDGSIIWAYSSGRAGGPRSNDVAVGDIDGDGKKETVFAGADTLVHVVNAQGGLAWTYNTGDEVGGVECIDVNGDGKDEIIATSLSFNVYCIDGDANTVWRTDLQSPVRAAQVFVDNGTPKVAVGCDNGSMYVLDATDGRVIGQFETGGEIIAIAAGQSGDAWQLAVSSKDGKVYTVDAP